MRSQRGAYDLHAELARLNARARMHTPTRLSTHMHACTHRPTSNTYLFSTTTNIRERTSVLRYTQTTCLVSFDTIVPHMQCQATACRTPLYEGSPCRRNLYLKIHKSQERYIHAPVGIRTGNPSKRLVANPRLRSLFHRSAIQSIVFSCVHSEEHIMHLLKHRVLLRAL